MNDTNNGTKKYDFINYPCNQGNFLPLVSEYPWSLHTRGFMYLVGLLWCFFAVAIIADVFMCAIEHITSATRVVRVPDESVSGGYREYHVKIWNDTVANLSLMALGTSAPEILLSVVEIFGNNFKAGDLGPGTIVGSAAFNLHFITAICVMCIPEGETRSIAMIKVFTVTTIIGLFAYVWMAVVLVVISPNKVEIAEAVVTLLMFPMLLIIAYTADRNCFIGNPDEEPETGGIGIDGRGGEDSTGGTTERKVELLAKTLAKEPDIKPELAAKISARRISECAPKTINWYRIKAHRELSGARKLYPPIASDVDHFDTSLRFRRRSSVAITPEHDVSRGGSIPVVEIGTPGLAVLEEEGKITVDIQRYGKLDCPVSVRVTTQDGTALETEDYIAVDEVVTFAPGVTLTSVDITIVNDEEWEPDEFFFVKLQLDPGSPAVLGAVSVCEITIVDDDDPGMFSFAKASIVIKESVKWCSIPVLRKNGADGHADVHWKTTDITAISGQDYDGGQGVLHFTDKQTSAVIEIAIFENDRADRDDSFQIILHAVFAGRKSQKYTGQNTSVDHPPVHMENTSTRRTSKAQYPLIECGAKLGRPNRCVVIIVKDEEYDKLVKTIMTLTQANLDAITCQQSSYSQQFREAMNVNGGDLDSATFGDYVLHFITFFWKILFAFVPPPQYLGGWPAFILSLAAIGLVTAIIRDFASIFGCLMGLEDAITAITLVALGTSTPDTFASMQAALSETTADSSIGNVNGSNAVNVFLGLGLPWLIAALYWDVKEGRPFDVPAGSLGFSVCVFSATAVLTIGVLVLRRNILGAELGGPTVPKYASGIFMICMWLLYIVLSILQARGVIDIPIGTAPEVSN